MILGNTVRAVSKGLAASKGLKAISLALALLVTPQAVFAAATAAATQATSAAPAAAPVAADPATKDAAVRSPDTAGNAGTVTTAENAKPQAGSYARMKPTPGIGMPVDGGIGLQKQFSPLGEYAKWFHNGILLPLIIAITLFVLILLVWVVVRFNHRSNPVPSRTSHNTLIEVVWTLLPVLILVGVAVPSIDLLAKQYKPAPKAALTIKITGNQWFWTYKYPDNGDFEVTSYMLNLPGQPVVNNGVREVGSDPSDGPAHLEVDNRMVVPVGEPIRIQTIGADVIHSFGVPSLWFKLDAVPGRINEKVLFIEKPGVYYGQCSELCGVKHGYMPIAVEALPRDKYNAWVLTQSGGVIDGQKKAGADVAEAPAAAAAPAAAVPAPAAATSSAAPEASASAPAA
jgi:cytochrome c oxidase subunit 2